MEESNVKKTFEHFLDNNKIPFERDVVIKGAVIDYKTKLDGLVVLVEAKSDRSDTFGAIGQLVNAKRTCSHVFLVAPPNFIKKIIEIDEETGVLSNIGFIEMQNGEVSILRKPSGSHYYKEHAAQKTRKKHPKKSSMHVSKTDMVLLNDFENKTFFITDVAKKYGKSVQYAQHIVDRLKKAKLIEIANNGSYPIVYKVVRKNVCLNEWIGFK